MIYISAQPDEYYFLWQLELQLYNFMSLGIAPGQIHILIGYHPKAGLSTDFKTFIEKYPEVNIQAYQDTRPCKNYLSSIRPHILAKHFNTFPELRQETIFYHDSDIVFSRLPDFSQLLNDRCWYSSDTRSYLDSNYIKTNSSGQVFQEMCDIVGISPEQVIQEDKNAGGAQYVLKDCNAGFWEKIELDCEKLYVYLETYKLNQGFCTKHQIIDPWLSDMWVLWWNAILSGRKFRRHEELNFSWAHSPVKDWFAKPILHYTGNVDIDSKTLFRKSNYTSCSPFYHQFLEIDQTSCSYPLVKLISEFNSAKIGDRIDLSDISFLIVVRVDAEDRLENTYAITDYLCNNFKTNLLLMEVDQQQKVDKSRLHKDVKYFYKDDKNQKIHRTKYNNELISLCATPYVALYDVDVIVPSDQLVASLNVLRKGYYKVVLPFDGRCLDVDILLKSMFIKVLDEKFLKANQNKQNVYAKRAVGGCVFLDRVVYQNCGGDNEYLTSWGPEDAERIKRIKILGYKLKRISGVLYHLHHSRNENSGYQSMDESIRLKEEYLKVCNSSKNDLVKYIQTWNWLGAFKNRNDEIIR